MRIFAALLLVTLGLYVGWLCVIEVTSQRMAHSEKCRAELKQGLMVISKGCVRAMDSVARVLIVTVVIAVPIGAFGMLILAIRRPRRRRRRPRDDDEPMRGEQSTWDRYE